MIAIPVSFLSFLLRSLSRQLTRLLLLVPPILPELFILHALLLLSNPLFPSRVHSRKPLLSRRILLLPCSVLVHAGVHRLLLWATCEGRSECFVGTASGKFFEEALALRYTQ